VGLIQEKKEVSQKPSDNTSYIIKESMPDRAYKVFSETLSSGYKGLCITRTDPGELKKKYDLNTPFIWLTRQKNKDFLTSVNTEVLKMKIKDFIRSNKKSIILLDRLDYLINMNGFHNVLKFIYSVNDEVVVNDSILMLNVNPLTLNQQELTLLEQELRDLPKPRGDAGSELGDDLQEILIYVNSNEKVSFKNVSKNFSITKTTTRKRINKLADFGLLTVKKNGRNKVVRITESGRNFL